MADEFLINVNIRHVPTKLTLPTPFKKLTQAGRLLASGTVTSTTTATDFDLSILSSTTPGFAIFVNQDPNDDIQIGNEITTVTEGAVFYPLDYAKPGVPMLRYLHESVLSSRPLQHKVASGTAPLSYFIYEA